MLDWVVGSVDRWAETKQQAAEREEAIAQLREVAGYAKIGTITGIAIVALGLISLSSTALGGVFLMAVGAVVWTASHDFAVISENAMDYDRDPIIRGKCKRDNEAAVDHFVKNTWIIKDFFAEWIKEEMRKGNRSR